MSCLMKRDILFTAEELLVNTFYNPIAHCIGRHIKEFSPCTVK